MALSGIAKLGQLQEQAALASAAADGAAAQSPQPAAAAVAVLEASLARNADSLDPSQLAQVPLPPLLGVCAAHTEQD